MALLSISEGFIVSFNRSISQVRESVIVFPRQEGLSPTFIGMPSSLTFPADLLPRIKEVEGVRGVFPILTRPLPLPAAGPMPFPATLQGVTPDYFPSLRPYLRPQAGRVLEAGDRQALVLGPTVAQRLGIGVGGSVKVQGVEMEVVGILEPTNALDDFNAYAPLEALGQLYGVEGQVSLAAVQLADPSRADEVARRIDQEMPALEAITLKEIQRSFLDLIGIARGIHAGVAAIAVLIGILFVLTTMLMAVTERTRELGTLRAIGASRPWVFRLILVESLVLALSGGVLGVAGGLGLSRLISFLLSQVVGAGFLETVVTPRLYVWGLGVALVVGALAGLYPAWRVSRLRIVEALRYE